MGGYFATVRYVATTVRGCEGGLEAPVGMQMGGAYARRRDSRLGWRPDRSRFPPCLPRRWFLLAVQVVLSVWLVRADAVPRGGGEPLKYRSDNNPRKRRRIVTTSVAIIAAAAIAVGVSLYNKSAAPVWAVAGSPADHASVLPGGVCGRCSCLVRRGDSVHERHRGQARCTHVLQRLV